MSRGLAARLVKLEQGRMSPQARYARMSDEALAAEIDRLHAPVLAGLMQGSEVERAFGRTIQGKRAAELTPSEQHQLLAILQGRLADQDCCERQHEGR
jgi:ribosomal protein L16 Arg81 hydroxylase